MLQSASDAGQAVGGEGFGCGGLRGGFMGKARYARKERASACCTTHKRGSARRRTDSGAASG